MFHVLTSGTWTPDNLTTLAETLITWETTVATSSSPQASRNEGTSLLSVSARDLTTATGPEVIVSPTGGPIVGTNPSGAVNNGLSASTKLSTGMVGRSFRGRVYWIGLSENALQTDQNLLASAFGVSLVNYYTALMNAIHAANDHWQLSVLSRFTQDPGPPPVTVKRAEGIATPVTSVAVVDPYVDFQRRRAPGHARHH